MDWRGGTSRMLAENTGSGTQTLWDAFCAMPDHRRGQGRRYPLPALLTIALAAMLAGRRSQLAIIRWGRKLNAETLATLGIRRGRIPCPSVWCEFWAGLKVDVLEKLLGQWVLGETDRDELTHIAIDGKRLRGSRTGDTPGVHLLAAFSSRLEGVIGQIKVEPDSNEITAALVLLKELPLEGMIVTGDAIFTQKEICQTIIDRSGHYFFTVKMNQPTLHDDIALAFGSDSPLCAVRPA